MNILQPNSSSLLSGDELSNKGFQNLLRRMLKAKSVQVWLEKLHQHGLPISRANLHRWVDGIHLPDEAMRIKVVEFVKSAA